MGASGPKYIIYGTWTLCVLPRSTLGGCVWGWSSLEPQGLGEVLVPGRSNQELLGPAVLYRPCWWCPNLRSVFWKSQRMLVSSAMVYYVMTEVFRTGFGGYGLQLFFTCRTKLGQKIEARMGQISDPILL